MGLIPRAVQRPTHLLWNGIYTRPWRFKRERYNEGKYHTPQKKITQSSVLKSPNQFQLPPEIKPLEDMDHEQPAKKDPYPPLIYVVTKKLPSKPKN